MSFSRCPRHWTPAATSPPLQLFIRPIPRPAASCWTGSVATPAVNVQIEIPWVPNPSTTHRRPPWTRRARPDHRRPCSSATSATCVKPHDPDHLLLGTNAENMADWGAPKRRRTHRHRSAKGKWRPRRSRPRRSCGSRCSVASSSRGCWRSVLWRSDCRRQCAARGAGGAHRGGPLRKARQRQALPAAGEVRTEVDVYVKVN